MNQPNTFFRKASALFTIAIISTKAFEFPPNPRLVLTKLASSSSYGRGAEIWPECNEDPVQLADSFPNGIIPPGLLNSSDKLPEESRSKKKGLKNRSSLPHPIQQILKRAAGFSQNRKKSSIPIEKLPAIITLSLLIFGLIQPVDVLVEIAISGYLTILYFWAKLPRDDGKTPILPSLPPQGHVPDLILNPLGVDFSASKTYDLWIKSGFILSLLAPSILFVTDFFLSPATKALKLVEIKAGVRPLFYLCCQALTESIFRRAMAPIPLRILVPLMYNAARLVPLLLWLITSNTTKGKILATSNLIYWSLNLFGFLIPTASMRYLRTHFFCVEAEQVTTRPGFESTVGLLP